MMPQRSIVVAILVCFLGCSEPAYPPVDSAAVEKFKAPIPLAKLVEELGEPHEPTSRQGEQIKGTIARMPEPFRSDAESDRAVAWGDDSTFLVAKVNDQGVVWLTSYARGGGGPPPGPRGEQAIAQPEPVR